MYNQQYKNTQNRLQNSISYKVGRTASE